jgi:hypothetical protein
MTARQQWIEAEWLARGYKVVVEATISSLREKRQRLATAREAAGTRHQLGEIEREVAQAEAQVLLAEKAEQAADETAEAAYLLAVASAIERTR